ncbi:uncharacterized protein LOC131844943 [Achroia grisella]|uniref:uncharacterized protein LOC131844943 n=1 Tax=Achroia grisella TaxID=688607 RepID=UPI0027D20933|nr:uncharacterized protein LOC131844943 [Achroia grisella]
MLKRTPPQTPTSVSAPNIPSLSQEIDPDTPQGSSVSHIISRGLKRHRVSESTEIKDYFMEMFTTWKTDQDIKFNTLINAMTEIKEQNADIRQSLDFMSSKYDGLLDRVTLLEEERKRNINLISLLENKLENMERNLKSSSIEMRNVPQQRNETKEDLLNLVKVTGSALNISLQTSDIRDVYRVNATASGSKPIIAELNSSILRNNLIHSIKNYNKENKSNKFSSTNLHISGPSQPIYISESLSSKTKRLFYLARTAAQTNNYKFCWTRYGRIYVRKSEGASQLIINSENDIKALTQ